MRCELSNFSIFQVKQLYQKIQSQAESLKGLWVAKLNLKGRSALATQEDLQDFEYKRDEVIIIKNSNCFSIIFIYYFNVQVDIRKHTNLKGDSTNGISRKAVTDGKTII